MTQRGNSLQMGVVAVMRQRSIPMPAHNSPDRAHDEDQRLAPPAAYRAPAVVMERGGVRCPASREGLAPTGCERQGYAAIFPTREAYGMLDEAVRPGVPNELPRVAGQSASTPARRVFGDPGPCTRCGSDEAPA